MRVDLHLMRTKQTIARKEAISATDASGKDGNASGVWKIEDFHECESTSNIMWSRNWRNNTSLASEVEIILDLVEIDVHSMRGNDKDKIKTQIDCSKMWELLTANNLKAIQFALFSSCGHFLGKH